MQGMVKSVKVFPPSLDEFGGDVVAIRGPAPLGVGKRKTKIKRTHDIVQVMRRVVVVFWATLSLVKDN